MEGWGGAFTLDGGDDGHGAEHERAVQYRLTKS